MLANAVCWPQPYTRSAHLGVRSCRLSRRCLVPAASPASSRGRASGISAVGARAPPTMTSTASTSFGCGNRLTGPSRIGAPARAEGGGDAPARGAPAGGADRGRRCAGRGAAWRRESRAGRHAFYRLTTHAVRRLDVGRIRARALRSPLPRRNSPLHHHAALPGDVCRSPPPPRRACVQSTRSELKQE